jgi:hypothetical protein
VHVVLKMDLDGAAAASGGEYDTAEMKKYGLGDKRSIAQYLEFAGIDLKTKSCDPRCQSAGQLDRTRLHVI